MQWGSGGVGMGAAGAGRISRVRCVGVVIMMLGNGQQEARMWMRAMAAAVAGLVERLLAKDPSARPASAEEVAAVLEPFTATADSFASIDFSLPEPTSLGPTSRAELTCVADAPNPWAEITNGIDPEPSGVSVSDHTQVMRKRPVSRHS